MTSQINLRKPRGVVAVRADGSNPTAILAELQRTFETFKQERDEEIQALKKGQEDVVKTDKVDRINAEITTLQNALDDVNRTMAALQVGGGSAPNAAAAEHSRVFQQWFRRGERGIDADLHQLEVQAALSTDSDPDGGYVVPEEMSMEIDRVVGTISAMRDVATVMPIGTDIYKKLVNMAGTGSGWVGERESRTETDTPTLRELTFNAMELYANPAITQRALDDARLDLAGWLANEVSIEFAEQEGSAFITGDGVAKPRGILGYDTVANASYEWGKLGFVTTGVAAALSDASNNGVDALMSLYFGLKQQYRNGASFMMADSTMEDIRKLKDDNGQYLFAPPTAMGELPAILGKPVRTDDNMDAVGANDFPVAFGNFQRGYLIIDRFGTRVLRDPYTNKPYVHFYTTKRVGGGVQNFEAIKLLKVAA